MWSCFKKQLFDKKTSANRSLGVGETKDDNFLVGGSRGDPTRMGRDPKINETGVGEG